jgi:hypothetical protein
MPNSAKIAVGTIARIARTRTSFFMVRLSFFSSGRSFHRIGMYFSSPHRASSAGRADFNFE